MRRSYCQEYWNVQYYGLQQFQVESGAERKKGCRPFVLSPRIASSHKPGMTARKVKDETGGQASLRTVQRTLSTRTPCLWTFQAAASIDPNSCFSLI